MTPEDRRAIEGLIQEHIRAHETRVGLVSGIAGLVIIGGLFHAVWLLR